MADSLKNVIAQSLECPVCLNTFTDPKILFCSHTYCKACLDNLLECHGNDQMLRCPVCRAETQVPNQDVSKLPANLALRSLIEDVKNHYHFCSVCKSEDKTQAVVYCQDCDKYLCITCHNTHSLWRDFISHEVLAISEIESGKVSVRRYRKCRKHPKEDEECFCSDCRRFACFRCVVMEHKDEGHRIIEAAVYENSHMENIEVLKSKAEKKRSCFQKYVDFIDEQKERVSNVQKQCTDDINKQPMQSCKKGESIIFKRNGRMEELTLGKIVNGVAKSIALPSKDSMNAMVSTPDGRMAVGCRTGGVEIFSADGQIKQTVFKHVEILGVGFLSDDRYVILDASNNITLYTLEYTKLKVRFETLSSVEGGIANLTVDDDDQIYVSYWNAQKIQVFSPAGGKAIWEIPCDGYVPVQITSYNDYLIIASGNTIRLIDKQGDVKYELAKSGDFVRAVVSQGNTILTATVKHDEGFVSIDEYSNELKHVQNLVGDYKIEKPEEAWYYLQQYKSGEIAFCTPDRLYIFY
eukprot:XP_011665508.1 PREDICTED: uncharacterized protein LOC105438864 [Strongylocentrotus purpuratus]